MPQITSEVSLKLSQLRCVVAIAERGSLRAASRQLHVAQPALTRSVQELERELGTALFDRLSHGMVLTPVGEAFIARARAVLGDLRRAEEEIAQMGGGTGGSVSVALSAVPHMAILPRVLAQFGRRYPDLTLDLIESVYPNVEPRLRDGSVDFYMGPRPERDVPPDLLEEPAFAVRRVILARRYHPQCRATTLAALAECDWASTSITLSAERELADLFALQGLAPPRVRVRTQSALSLMIAVAYSDLLAMTPEQWVSFQPFAGAFVALPITMPLPPAQIVVVWRTGLALTPAAEHFLDLVRNTPPGLVAPYA
jgi:DNA-binding transcriptional LysR family regulator